MIRTTVYLIDDEEELITLLSETVELAKGKGVKDVAFHKKRGLIIEQMVKSRWVYRK